MPSQLKDDLENNFTDLHTLHPVYTYLASISFANNIGNNDYCIMTLFFLAINN